MTIRRYFFTSLISSFFGTVAGAYLIWMDYDPDALICVTGQCEVVQTSSYATVFGVPIAIFGTAMYLAKIALSLLRLEPPDMVVPLGTAALATTGASTLYCGWLTWLKIYEIEVTSEWCVASATITKLLSSWKSSFSAVSGPAKSMISLNNAPTREAVPNVGRLHTHSSEIHPFEVPVPCE